MLTLEEKETRKAERKAQREAVKDAARIESERNQKPVKDWNLQSRDIQTGQDRYIYTGDELNPPIVLAHGNHYKVSEFYATDNSLEWVMGERLNNGVVFKASLSPDEIERMELGYSDNRELDLWIALKRGII